VLHWGRVMRKVKLAKLVRPLLASATLLLASPATARITVVDGGLTMAVGGYCTPDGGTDCDPQALPFAIAIGGTTYTSFVLNGNGTLTLGDTPADWSTLANTAPDLSAYTMPVFAPETDNTIFSRTNLLDPSGSDFHDTKWAASVTTTSDSLTAYWFICSTAIFCGTESLDASLYDGPLTEDQVRDRQTWGMFGLTLSDLGSGFQLDYFYYPAFAVSPDFETFPIDPTGTYGFNLPGTASLQSTGLLVNRTWTLPEPGTWLTMLLGFAGTGFVLRRRRERKPEPA
jgi:PEP-CTERM motif